MAKQHYHPPLDLAPENPELATHVTSENTHRLFIRRPLNKVKTGRLE